MLFYSSTFIYKLLETQYFSIVILVKHHHDADSVQLILVYICMLFLQNIYHLRLQNIFALGLQNIFALCNKEFSLTAVLFYFKCAPEKYGNRLTKYAWC